MLYLIATVFKLWKDHCKTSSQAAKTKLSASTTVSSCVY